MQKRTSWNGTYRDIGFEIQNFSFEKTYDPGQKQCWTFYIFINLSAIPEEYHAEFWLPPRITDTNRVVHNYSYGLIPELTWHHGCTFYEKTHGFEGGHKVVKIGCDYQHYWDEGNIYSENSIYADVKECIDSLHERIKDMKVRCIYNGKYYFENEGERLSTSGDFISNEGILQQTKYNIEKPRLQGEE